MSKRSILASCFVASFATIVGCASTEAEEPLEGSGDQAIVSPVVPENTIGVKIQTTVQDRLGKPVTVAAPKKLATIRKSLEWVAEKDVEKEACKTGPVMKVRLKFFDRGEDVLQDYDFMVNADGCGFSLNSKTPIKATLPLGELVTPAAIGDTLWSISVVQGHVRAPEVVTLHNAEAEKLMKGVPLDAAPLAAPRCRPDLTVSFWRGTQRIAKMDICDGIAEGANAALSLWDNSDTRAPLSASATGQVPVGLRVDATAFLKAFPR